MAALRAAYYRLTGADDAHYRRAHCQPQQGPSWKSDRVFREYAAHEVTADEKDTTFNTRVKQVRATATAAFANQDVPFKRIVSTLLRGSQDASRNPLVQLLFALHSQMDRDGVELEGMSAEPALASIATRLGLEFHLFQAENSLSGKVLY